MEDTGKKPVIIVVGNKRYTLQIPCPHCHGGTEDSYDPTTKYAVGRCRHCHDGMIDTPLGAAFKHHFGIFDELEGRWMGRPERTFLFGGEWPKPSGTLHFYPSDWFVSREHDLALCTQGEPSSGLVSSEEGEEGNYHLCQNCLKIKQAREHGEPVVYG